MELRQRALQALQISDPQEKVDQSIAIWSQFDSFSIADDGIPEPPGLPGRPAHPKLVAPTLVPHRSAFTMDGRAAMIHAICHIEFNAINIGNRSIKFHDENIVAFPWVKVNFTKREIPEKNADFSIHRRQRTASRRSALGTNSQLPARPDTEVPGDRLLAVPKKWPQQQSPTMQT